MDKTVYIDTPTAFNGKGEFSHMSSQDLDGLHKMAEKLGLKRCWFENKRGMNRPHYDVRKKYYRKAIEFGAVPLSLRAYSQKMSELFGPYLWKLKK